MMDSERAYNQIVHRQKMHILMVALLPRSENIVLLTRVATMLHEPSTRVNKRIMISVNGHNEEKA
jgi:hypothetical protein